MSGAHKRESIDSWPLEEPHYKELSSKILGGAEIEFMIHAVYANKHEYIFQNTKIYH